MIYHFMFGAPYETGCPVCSSIADTLSPQVEHLKARDTTLLLVSRAPLKKLLAFRKRMGWGIDWVSSAESEFNRDLGFVSTPEQLKPFAESEMPATVVLNAEMCGTDEVGYVAERPGLSVYALSDGKVYLTYVTTSRGSNREWPITDCWTGRPRVATRAPRPRCGFAITTTTSRPPTPPPEHDAPSGCAGASGGVRGGTGGGWVAWWWTVIRMAGMDTGPGTDLGTLGWFTGVGVDDGGDDAAVDRVRL